VTTEYVRRREVVCDGRRFRGYADIGPGGLHPYEGSPDREGRRGNGEWRVQGKRWSVCLGCAECGAIARPCDYSDRIGAAS